MLFPIFFMGNESIAFLFYSSIFRYLLTRTGHTGSYLADVGLRHYCLCSQNYLWVLIYRPRKDGLLVELAVGLWLVALAT